MRILLACLIVSIGCTNYYKYPTYADSGNTFGVVEIPAGTNIKYEYNVTTNKFNAEEVGDEPRKINYLPYPVNYGFIPSTLMERSKGGDGDPLDVIMISSHIKNGSILEFIPVAVLRMKDQGKEDHKIVGVVVNSPYAILNCTTYDCLKSDHKEIVQSLESWFSNYKGNEQVTILGWEDEEAAQELIRKWKVEED